MDGNDLYQALWRCRICGSAALLADSHRHCPNCSHARDYEETELPDWDALSTLEGHRFTGAEHDCCDQGWAATARFCGRCGSTLVPRATQAVAPTLVPFAAAAG